MSALERRAGSRLASWPRRASVARSCAPASCCALVAPAVGLGPRRRGDLGRARPGEDRHHRQGRALRGPRRQAPDRDGAGPRRLYRPHGGAGGDAGHQSRLARLRAVQPDLRARSCDGWSRRVTRSPIRACSGPSSTRRRIAAVTPSLGFRPEPLEERSRRHVPSEPRAGPDRHLRRRAELAPRCPGSTSGTPTPTSRSSRTACCSTACCSASPACSPSS